jgi:hemerythrin superfamily protein
MAGRGRLDIAQREDRKMLRASAMLAHHEHMDQQLARVATTVEHADLVRARLQIDELRLDLLAHFEAEEAFILPRMRDVDREVAQALVTEHDQLRAELDELGADAAISGLRPEQVHAFGARLKAHSEREESLMYPWARERLGDWVWAKIARQITPAPVRAGNA